MELDVVTVSRQLGSEGDRIAENVAKALGYEYVDRRLVEEIASITDTSVEEVEKYDEKGEGRVRYFLKRLLVPEMSPGGFPLSSAAYFPEFGLEFPYVLEREGGEQAAYLDRGTYQLLITTLDSGLRRSRQGGYRRPGKPVDSVGPRQRRAREDHRSRSRSGASA